MNLNRAKLIVCLAFLSLSNSHTLEAELYSWIDEEGSVQYSDQVPPSHSQRVRRVYSDQGQFISTIEGPKSEEERALEEQRVELNAQQEREREAEKWYDRMLLGTFLSVKDLEDARDSQISFIDSAIQIFEHKLADLKNTLVKLDRDAEVIEQRGMEPPKWIGKRKLSTTEQIRLLEEHLAEKEKERQSTEERFSADIQRFLRLKGRTSD